MNSELLERYEEAQRKKALKMIRALERKLERGELKVVTSGMWEGMKGTWNFSVSTREEDNFRPFTEIP